MTQTTNSTYSALRRGVFVKAVVAMAVGSATWAVSEQLQQRTDDQGWVNSLLLSLLVGGVVFLMQFMTQFERRVADLENTQRQRLEEVGTLFEEAARSRAKHEHEVRASLEDNFAKVSKATRIYALMEDSPFGAAAFEDLVNHANRLGLDTPQLFRELIAREVRRLSGTVQRVAASGVAHYDGEDREWLLALAASATRSIEAVSISIVDAGGHGFDSGLWTSDLGERYLELQADGITRRKIQVRRVFISDRPRFREDLAFRAVVRRQQLKGVEVRVLDWFDIPEERRADVTDLIVFDEELTYELKADHISPNWLPQGSQRPATTIQLRTELHSEPLVVARRLQILRDLWQLATPPAGLDTVDPSPLMSAPSVGGEDVAGPVADLTRQSDPLGAGAIVDLTQDGAVGPDLTEDRPDGGFDEQSPHRKN